MEIANFKICMKEFSHSSLTQCRKFVSKYLIYTNRRFSVPDKLVLGVGIGGDGR